MPTQVGPSSPIFVGGLVNDQEYPGAQVRARNALGWGPWSPLSLPFTPSGTGPQLIVVSPHGVGRVTALLGGRPAMRATVAGHGAVTANLGALTPPVGSVTVSVHELSFQTLNPTPGVQWETAAVNTVSPSPFNVDGGGVLVNTIAPSTPVQPAIAGTAAGVGTLAAAMTTPIVTTVLITRHAVAIESFVVAPAVTKAGVAVNTVTALPIPIRDEGTLVGTVGT